MVLILTQKSYQLKLIPGYHSSGRQHDLSDVKITVSFPFISLVLTG